jgi:hypothetical protein
MRFLFTFLLLSIYNISTAQIPSYVPTNGLVGWWPFNGNANDESGNGHNGTVYGATLTTDRFGNVGKAYYFDGVNDFIESTDIGIVGNSERSVSFWAMTSSIESMGLVNWGGNSSYPNNGGRFSCVFNYETQGVTIDGADCAITYNPIVNVSNNQWNYYTFVMNQSNSLNQVKVYQNSVLLTTSLLSYFPNTNINTVSGTTLQFGRINYPPINYDFYSGSLDDIAIYNRALTQQEISQLYNGTITPSTPEDTTSNVGIGTITPKRKLHVNDVMRLEPRNSAPANPGEGDIYYDAILKKLRYYNGTNWINL